MDENCREMLTSLSRFLDGECAEDIEEIIARHLVDCPPCLDRADFERELRALVKHKCKDSAPPELLERVVRWVGS